MCKLSASAICKFAFLVRDRINVHQGLENPNPVLNDLLLFVCGTRRGVLHFADNMVLARNLLRVFAPKVSDEQPNGACWLS
jgi:hypothetical protein